MKILKTMNIYRLDTAKYTVDDIKAEIIEDLEILKYHGYKTIPPEKINVAINNRFKRAFGRCDKKEDGFTIQINGEYLRVAEPKHIHNTIMHEVLHTLPNCFNHGIFWKTAAQKVNYNYGFTISRLSYDANYACVEKEKNKNKPLYVIFCPSCNRVVGRYKNQSKVYKAVLSTQDSPYIRKKYRCGTCGDRNLIARVEFN